MRTQIRKNAYEYIGSMSSGDVVNRVRYVAGDVRLSGSAPSNYETLVVRDGNVIVDADFNSGNAKFGIIVLKDRYDTGTGYRDKGNVYITPNVTKLNAAIYADGGLISTNAAGTPYSQDSYERTRDLKNRLTLRGSVFTRNTVGGAILSGGYYLLP